MLSFICFILLGIGMVILLIDLIPAGRDWLGRIHIGRYPDRQLWNRSITRRGLKWLNTTPRIQATDNTRLIALDMMRGDYSKAAIQHWQEAALVLGLAEYLKINDDPQAKAGLLKFVETKFDRSGQWIKRPKHVDAAILAYAIMKLDLINRDRYRPAFDAVWELIREHAGEEDTIQYRTFMRSYRYVDTIGFICPFLTSYGIRYGKEECVDLAVRQIQAYEANGMPEGHSLPSHAYQLGSKVPLGLVGWGRGLGWFAIGLIDVWNELPAGHPRKSAIEASVRRFAGAVRACQQEQGNWNWTVTRRESRPDSSATATLGWFMLQASDIADIAGPCLDSAERAIGWLMRATRRSGAVDFSQGDTKDIGVYSTLFNILPFTQGFAIRLMNAYAVRFKG